MKQKLFLCWIGLDYYDLQFKKIITYPLHHHSSWACGPQHEIESQDFNYWPMRRKDCMGNIVVKLIPCKFWYWTVLFQSFSSAALYHWAFWTFDFALKVTAQFFFLSAAGWLRGCGIFVLLIDNGWTDGFIPLAWGVPSPSFVVHSEACLQFKAVPLCSFGERLLTFCCYQY